MFLYYKKITTKINKRIREFSCLHTHHKTVLKIQTIKCLQYRSLCFKVEVKVNLSEILRGLKKG